MSVCIGMNWNNGQSFFYTKKEMLNLVVYSGMGLHLLNECIKKISLFY